MFSSGLDTRNMIRLGLFTIGCFLPIAFGNVYREFFVPLAFGSVDPSGRCPDGWTRFGSKCFVLIQDKQNWPEAQMTCDVLRGNLASISNAGENGVVSKMLLASTADKAWIGLHDLVTEGHFVWTKTNRAANYTNWKRGEPNNLNGKQHCGAVRRDQEWSDRPCSDRLPFVCETTDSHGR
ncbi:perlucin-like protein isoform X4 [Littorina saxatilis]|uniref:perlucin-like protein isoform X4 n=1 Tax=Littorina saxatilis TaxID=31220 RepID=UPI0038B67977